ncbi:hypothetical protein [Methyloceanibacter sp.]|uniref:hypothetical protein n=1 Tax=Methyloceanibacter sp. TaxID=1965321 RepID=UPI00351B768F
MMHRIFLIFLPVVAALALTLAPVSAEAAGGGGGQGGLGTSFGAVGGGRGSLGANPGAGGIGHGSLTGNLGSGSIGHGGASLSPGSHGSIGHLDVGHGDNGHVDVGLGSNRAPIGLGLNRGIGSPGGDDIHLGLSSRELGLGNNFGLNAPDNVLSRAARLPNSSNPPDLGAHTNDRPPLQGLNTNKDSAQSPQRANNSPAGADAKVQNFKNEEVQARRSVAIEEEELLQQEAKLQANLPQAPPPPTASPTTAPSIAQPAPTLPEDSTVVTTSLGSGEASMIGAYFAEHGAPVASVPTSSVNVSVGGTIPENVAVFPPPYDLANQVSDADFLYFVWGQSVVIVDGQTNVVTGIVPDVIAHQS